MKYVIFGFFYIVGCICSLIWNFRLPKVPFKEFMDTLWGDLDW